MVFKLFSRQPFYAKLSRSVALHVFLWFVAIELIVFLPSYSRREAQLSWKYETQAKTLLQPWIGLSHEELSLPLRQKILDRAIAETDLMGISLYNNQGEMMLIAGDPPQMSLIEWQQSQDSKIYDSNRQIIEIYLDAETWLNDYQVVAKFDATFLYQELITYKLHILGLIILIGFIVALGTILTLHPRVLKPIYQLRDDLLIVGDAIAKNNSRPKICSKVLKNNELGEVIEVFHSFVGEIYTAIQAREQVERELTHLNQTLQDEVLHRKLIEENLQNLNRQLQGLANSDGLTQLANRRSFDKTLLQEWRRMARQRAPISLIMFDVDFFKQFNDHYGHQQGDDCLITLAKTSQTVVKRPGDLLARYGGEEFVVILPHTDRAGAKVVAENIRSAILAQEIPHEPSSVSPWVTVSLGVCTQIPMPKSEPTNFLQQTDNALYQAKANGRNCVCCAHDLPLTTS